jgi:UDP-glucose 4-epimerase
VAVLRVADEIGSEGRSSLLSLLSLPVVPAVLGFDPRFQVIHVDDVVAALAHAVREDLSGVYNAAADGVLVLSEIVSLLGKPLLPILPPWGPGFAASQLQRLGLRIPVETIRQLRFGRGLDNRRLKASGYAYRYTSREAVVKLRAQHRLRPLLRSGAEAYTYEREVEDFLRWSPAVQHARTELRDGARAADHVPIRGYDELTVDEVVEIVASMEPDALARLRRYEAQNQARGPVLEALDETLARKGI